MWHKFSQNNIKSTKSNPRKNMTEVEKFIKKLHHLEKSGDLEVEHLLKALKIPDPALIEPLREMSRQYDWQPINDDLVVPDGCMGRCDLHLSIKRRSRTDQSDKPPKAVFRHSFWHHRGATVARGLGCVFAAGRGVRARYPA